MDTLPLMSVICSTVVKLASCMVKDLFVFVYDIWLSRKYIHICKYFLTDEADGFKFPGQTKVKFAVKMPRLHSAVSVEEFLPRSYHVCVQQKQGRIL